MKTGRTVLATVMLVSSLVAGAVQMPAAGRHVANVTGGRDTLTRVGGAQIANVTGGRDGATFTNSGATALA